VRIQPIACKMHVGLRELLGIFRISDRARHLQSVTFFCVYPIARFQYVRSLIRSREISFASTQSEISQTRYMIYYPAGEQPERANCTSVKQRLKRVNGGCRSVGRPGAYSAWQSSTERFECDGAAQDRRRHRGRAWGKAPTTANLTA